MNPIDIWHKIKQIPIIGKPYEKFIGSRRLKNLYKKKAKIIQRFGIDNINRVEKILENVVPLYFVDCGTLLGTVREHNFIAWDPDIDYGIVVDYSFDWGKLQESMQEAGYTKIRQWKLDDVITEQTYMRGEVTIDIFAHFKEQVNLIGYSYTRFPGKIYKDGWFDVYKIVTPSIDSTKKESLGETQVSVPENYDDYLSYIYNDDWRIPNPNWVPFSGKGTILLNNKQGRLFEGDC